MADFASIGNINGLASGWIVEIGGGSAFPQGTYSMFEIDSLTYGFERRGSPSFEMSAEDVVRFEKTGFLQVISPLAVNDNGDVIQSDP